MYLRFGYFSRLNFFRSLLSNLASFNICGSNLWIVLAWGPSLMIWSNFLKNSCSSLEIYVARRPWECIKYLKALPFFMVECLLGNCFKSDLGSDPTIVDFLYDCVNRVFLGNRFESFYYVAMCFFLGDWCVLSRLLGLDSLLKKAWRVMTLLGSIQPVAWIVLSWNYLFFCIG